jgi:hypothetical protein
VAKHKEKDDVNPHIDSLLPVARWLHERPERIELGVGAGAGGV